VAAGGVPMEVYHMVAVAAEQVAADSGGS